MKIINGKELGFMPNGTVFSDILDSHFDPNGSNGDIDINGLNIMAGHGKWNPVESGKFNGVLHMLGYITCYKTEVEETDEFDENDYSLTDTDSNDYTKDDWVVVYEKSEIKKIIKNLQWALNDCEED